MIDHLLSRMDPVSLDELDAKAALRARLDNKYLVPEPVLWALLDELEATHQVLDVDGRRQFAYDSAYFDSPDLDLHQAHVQGKRLRFKVRTRTYGDGRSCFAEVKLKGLRGATVKRRQPLPPEEHGHAGSRLHQFVDRCLIEHYGTGLNHFLIPAVNVAYDRLTVVHRDGVERVTVDMDLVTSSPQGDPSGRLRRGVALVEVKSTDGRGTTDVAMRQRWRRPVSLSKYGAAVALTYPDQPHAELRHLLSTTFVRLHPRGLRVVTPVAKPLLRRTG